MNRTSALIHFVLLVIPVSTCARPALADAGGGNLRNLACSYINADGIGLEKGICRRDPSDVVKAGDAWYVWYTKVVRADLPENLRSLYPSGYPGTIWYATSRDEGHSWIEQGQALSLGQAGSFDSFGVFTPNMMQHGGKYCLYYTAARPTPGRTDGVFENNSTNDFTAIALAVANQPDGPFYRVGTEPVLRPAEDAGAFDSYRVDDASLLMRNGKVWLYYKGRSAAHGRRGPGRTQMGLAVADQPAGPFVKSGGGRPLLAGSHEVLIWQHGTGVAALASISRTLCFASDGLRFQTIADLQDRPDAPGACRSELTDPVESTQGIRWGIAMRHGPHPYLVRYQLVRAGEASLDSD